MNVLRGSELRLAQDDPHEGRSPLYCTDSVVYFIRHGDDGPIKVGVAKDATKRRALLQCGNPVELHLLRTVPGDDRLERFLHHRLEAWKVRGEWFEAVAVHALIDRDDLEGYLEREYDAALYPGKQGFINAACLVCGCNLRAAFPSEVEDGDLPDVCSACEEFRWVRDENTDPFEGART